MEDNTFKAFVTEQYLDARLAALDARAAADRRKADTRRKVVIGAGVLALAARNPDFAIAVMDSITETSFALAVLMAAGSSARQDRRH